MLHPLNPFPTEGLTQHCNIVNAFLRREKASTAQTMFFTEFKDTSPVRVKQFELPKQDAVAAAGPSPRQRSKTDTISFPENAQPRQTLTELEESTTRSRQTRCNRSSSTDSAPRESVNRRRIRRPKKSRDARSDNSTVKETAVVTKGVRKGENASENGGEAPLPESSLNVPTAHVPNTSTSSCVVAQSHPALPWNDGNTERGLIEQILADVSELESDMSAMKAQMPAEQPRNADFVRRQKLSSSPQPYIPHHLSFVGATAGSPEDIKDGEASAGAANVAKRENHSELPLAKETTCDDEVTKEAVKKTDASHNAEVLIQKKEQDLRDLTIRQGLCSIELDSLKSLTENKKQFLERFQEDPDIQPSVLKHSTSTEASRINRSRTLQKREDSVPRKTKTGRRIKAPVKEESGTPAVKEAKIDEPILSQTTADPITQGQDVGRSDKISEGKESRNTKTDDEPLLGIVRSCTQAVSPRSLLPVQEQQEEATNVRLDSTGTAPETMLPCNDRVIQTQDSEEEKARERFTDMVKLEALEDSPASTGSGSANVLLDVSDLVSSSSRTESIAMLVEDLTPRIEIGTPHKTLDQPRSSDRSGEQSSKEPEELPISRDSLQEAPSECGRSEHPVTENHERASDLAPYAPSEPPSNLENAIVSPKLLVIEDEDAEAANKCKVVTAEAEVSPASTVEELDLIQLDIQEHDPDNLEESLSEALLLKEEGQSKEYVTGIEPASPAVLSSISPVFAREDDVHTGSEGCKESDEAFEASHVIPIQLTEDSSNLPQASRETLSLIDAKDEESSLASTVVSEIDIEICTDFEEYPAVPETSRTTEHPRDDSLQPETGAAIQTPCHDTSTGGTPSHAPLVEAPDDEFDYDIESGIFEADSTLATPHSSTEATFREPPAKNASSTEEFCPPVPERKTRIPTTIDASSSYLHEFTAHCLNSFIDSDVMESFFFSNDRSISFPLSIDDFLETQHQTGSYQKEFNLLLFDQMNLSLMQMRKQIQDSSKLTTSVAIPARHQLMQSVVESLQDVTQGWNLQPRNLSKDEIEEEFQDERRVHELVVRHIRNAIRRKH